MVIMVILQRLRTFAIFLSRSLSLWFIHCTRRLATLGGRFVWWKDHLKFESETKFTRAKIMAKTFKIINYTANWPRDDFLLLVLVGAAETKNEKSEIKYKWIMEWMIASSNFGAVSSFNLRDTSFACCPGPKKKSYQCQVALVGNSW